MLFFKKNVDIITTHELADFILETNSIPTGLGIRRKENMFTKLKKIFTK